MRRGRRLWRRLTWVTVNLTATVVAAAAAGGCTPRALGPTGEVITLERGASRAEIEAVMGRPPDEIRRVGDRREDWIYIEPQVRRSFVMRIEGGRLIWIKSVEHAGQRFSPGD